jgi:hypothetical protein
VAYGGSLADRLRDAGIDAFIDTHGRGYVKLAIELGVAQDRINTIIDFAAAQQYGVKAEGSQAALNAAVRRNSPGWLPPVSWKCRSPRPSRWLMCVRRSSYSSRATPEARSCCCPDS